MNAKSCTANLRFVIAFLAILCTFLVQNAVWADDPEPAAETETQSEPQRQESADDPEPAAETETQSEPQRQESADDPEPAAETGAQSEPERQEPADDPEPAAEPEILSELGHKSQARIDVVVVEWSGSDVTDIGTSVIFRRAPVDDPSRSGRGLVEFAQSNFPKFSQPSTLGFSLFVDKIRFHYGEIEAVFEALETNENVEILSRQTVLVAEGEQGRIATVNRVPYETTKAFGSTTAQITEFRNTGVTFTTRLEKIVENDFLVLLIAADVKELGRRITVALADQTSLKVPEFDSRRISTTVAVRDGDTLILGGLVTKGDTLDEQTIPFIGPAFKKLGKVPVLGVLSNVRYLFTSRRDREEYRELIFFVTPRIHRGRRVFLPEEMRTEPAPSSEHAETDISESNGGETVDDEE